MYRERCGIEVKESALSVCSALEEDIWDERPCATTVVEARRPGTKAKLLRLGNL